MKSFVIFLILIVPVSLFSAEYELGIAGIYEDNTLRESSGKKTTSSAYFFQFDESNRTSYGASIHFYRSFLLTRNIYFKTGPSFSYAALEMHDKYPDDFSAQGIDSMQFMFDFKFLYDKFFYAAPYLICGTGFTSQRTMWEVKSLRMKYVEELSGFAFNAGAGAEYKLSAVVHFFLQGLYVYKFLSPAVDGVNDAYVQDGNNVESEGWRVECGVNFNL